jgi:hypothetical protein
MGIIGSRSEPVNDDCACSRLEKVTAKAALDLPLFFELLG